jgi:hypothetical protein
VSLERGQNAGVKSPVEQFLAETEVGANPLAGRPLPERPRLGRVALDRYLSALAGPLPYMRRLRRIEEETARHASALDEAWRALAAGCAGDQARFRARWTSLAGRWSFAEVNELISRHNLYYPAEARLPMDPRSGDFVPTLGRSYRRRPLGAGWILTRFPPELALASA